MKIAFIGHRQIFAKDIGERVSKAVEEEVLNGCRFFTMGTHGRFDALALSVCRQMRNKYEDLEIEVVLTSLHAIEKDRDYIPYSDVKTVMYEIEGMHFKRQIISSNRRMIDNCDTLICYVDEKAYKSRAKRALLYAQKRGVRVINLFRETDRPFYGMTEEQRGEHMRRLLNGK